MLGSNLMKVNAEMNIVVFPHLNLLQQGYLSQHIYEVYDEKKIQRLRRKAQSFVLQIIECVL